MLKKMESFNRLHGLNSRRNEMVLHLNFINRISAVQNKLS
jgi:hypothetical protein